MARIYGYEDEEIALDGAFLVFGIPVIAVSSSNVVASQSGERVQGSGSDFVCLDANANTLSSSHNSSCEKMKT